MKFALDRRDFVRMSGGVLAGTALVGCASLVATRVTPADGQVRLAIRNYPTLSNPGGHLKILPRGMSNPLYVVVGATGGFTVLSSVCTHLHCIVKLESGRFVCPCHGSTYDWHGGVLEGPAEKPLPRYVSKTTADGMLVIDLEPAA